MYTRFFYKSAYVFCNFFTENCNHFGDVLLQNSRGSNHYDYRLAANLAAKIFSWQEKPEKPDGFRTEFLKTRLKLT
jgi:hypothetical protein